MFTTSIFGEYQQVLIRSDFKGLGFCPIALNSGWFLFVVSSFSFISVCLPLVLEGDISNLAGFTRCMGAINLVGGVVRFVYQRQQHADYDIHLQHTHAGVSGNSRPFPRMKASDSLSRIMGMDFFIPFLFLNFEKAFFHSLPFPE